MTTKKHSDALADQIAATSSLLMGVQAGRGRLGTALVLDGAKRWLITAAHLFFRTRGREVRLFLPDGTSATAVLRAVDRALDVAVLAVEDASVVLPPAPDWTAIPAAVRLGELAVTAGREGPDVRVTLGVVSMLRGAWRTPGGATVPRWLEVDATLPSASSGGLLLRLDGTPVGWNTHALTRQGAVLPLDLVHAAGLRAGEADAGLAGRGVLGVGVQPARLPGGPQGLLVTSLHDGAPAHRAGIIVGDVLTHLDEVPLHHPADLLRALAGRAGAPVRLSFLRGGAAQTLSVTPAAAHRCGRASSREE